MTLITTSLTTTTSHTTLPGKVNGGKTPGMHGEWTSITTSTKPEMSNTATTETNTPGIHTHGDTTQDGL